MGLQHIDHGHGELHNSDNAVVTCITRKEMVSCLEVHCSRDDAEEATINGIVTSHCNLHLCPENKKKTTSVHVHCTLN